MKIKCIIYFVLACALITAFYHTWSNAVLMKKPIAQSERLAVEKVLASTTNLIGTNIIEINRIAPDRVKVRTKSAIENGGDLIELEESNGQWSVIRKGAWLE